MTGSRASSWNLSTARRWRLGWRAWVRSIRGRRQAILAQVCEALAYLHSKGITHRDLKASNLKITPRGEVKLLDFGIAFKEGSKRVTRVGAIIGTPESLAPELLEGKPAGVASEMWGLGVVGYEMVTGSLPFQGEDDAELWKKGARAGSDFAFGRDSGGGEGCRAGAAAVS